VGVGTGVGAGDGVGAGPGGGAGVGDGAALPPVLSAGPATSPTHPLRAMQQVRNKLQDALLKVERLRPVPLAKSLPMNRLILLLLCTRSSGQETAVYLRLRFGSGRLPWFGCGRENRYSAERQRIKQTEVASSVLRSMYVNAQRIVP
jgi:hypothetical protein